MVEPMMTLAESGAERWTDRDSWDRFVAASPHGAVFCCSAFLDALDLEWEVWQVGTPAGARAAAVVLRVADGTIAAQPQPFCLYQGLLVAGAEAAASHRRVKEHLEASELLVQAMAGGGRMSWCLHPSYADVRPLSWFNYHDPAAGLFRLDVRYTGYIDLTPGAGLEPVLAGSRSVRRQEFRKAAQRFRVEASSDLDLLDHLHGLTFSRQGLERSPRERVLLRSIAAAALRDGFGELLVARDQGGEPAGAVLFLFDASTGYYLVGANDPAYRAFGVSTLLFLRGVERAIARGCSRVDVVGMNSPSRGDFKTSFGAVPVPYFVANWERP